MGEMGALVLIAALQSVVIVRAAKNPIQAFEAGWEDFLGSFTTPIITTTVTPPTTTTVTPLDSSASSGSQPNWLVSSNLGGAWQAKSSDADPLGSMKSWGFK